ncbi:unnamed protein product [Spodoptera exigua]|nr:unnamed protein product [Spodoptera exigua]
MYLIPKDPNQNRYVPITWLSSPRASVPCVVPDAARIPARRPPPPLEADDRPRPKPYVWKKGDEDVKRVLNNGTLEVSKKKDGSSEGVYQCTVRHHAGLVLGYPVHIKFASERRPLLDKGSLSTPRRMTNRHSQLLGANSCAILTTSIAVACPLPLQLQTHSKSCGYVDGNLEIRQRNILVL